MTPLKPYQLVGAKELRRANGVDLVADEMGLGKTLMVLYWCFKMRRTRPVIIVCPAHLKWVWEREALHHLDMASEVLSGRKPPKIRQQLANCHAPILIINYEILTHWVDYLILLDPQVVVFDESHYICNRLSQRYLALERLCVEARIPHRIAMSGTPLTNRPADLWTVIHLLWPKEFPNFSEYAFYYCKPKRMHGKWTFSGAVHLDELHAHLKRLGMIRRLKKDVAPELGMKERVVVPVEIMERDEYEFARSDFFTWLRNKSPSRAKRAAKNIALTRVGYLLRLVAKLKRFEVLKWITNFLEASDEKLVIFSCHTRLIEWVIDHNPKICVRIDGQVTGLKRRQAVDDFQERSRIRLAVCNPKAAGVGLTLTAASNVLYTDFPWTPGIVKQGEDRIHRIGQTKQCFIWMLAARNTIEERLCELLTEKQSILDQVLDGDNVKNDLDIFQELLRSSKHK